MPIPTPSTLPLCWIPTTFQKRECSKFILSENEKHKCGCGRIRAMHSPEALITSSPSPRSPHASLPPPPPTPSEEVSENSDPSIPKDIWSIQKNTICYDTDAYGTIEFQGGPHPHKAQFVRLGFDSEPENIMRLFTQVWGIAAPNLVITVQGGLGNFDLHPKLSRAFRKGLLKAAKTTGAWIITSGINAGVVRHVGSAISEAGHAKLARKKKLVTIGITPWGLLKKRDDLVSKTGKEVSVPYHPQAFSPKGRLAVLNDKHSYFLLVDNGVVSRYGADIVLRKRLEEYISKQTIDGSSSRKGGFVKGKTIPVVCVVVEGGECTIKAVLEYVTNKPAIPVVVCDGSRRAADLIAYAHKHSHMGEMDENKQATLQDMVESCLFCKHQQAETIVKDLLKCVKKKELDVDHAILTALLKGQQLSAPDQLSLALTWDRADIARSDIFVLGQEWPPGSLDAIMMEALLHDRVDFVRLLLANGVSMERFLTMQRLEELYNQKQEGNKNTLKYILKDVKPDYKEGRDWISLPLIGLCMRQLMGGTYNSRYLRKDFKIKYDSIKERIKREMFLKTEKVILPPMQDTSRSRGSYSEMLEMENEERSEVHSEPAFYYPFNELLVWSVLTNRHIMAKCFWCHGEEALAKALVACKLYKSLANEAADDYLEQEICIELNQNSEEFRKYSLDLLEACYQTHDDVTMQLLTYELGNWGKQTCLTLAVIAHHQEFLAHPGCQILLADLWNGGLRIRRYVNWKVLFGLIFPPYILFLEYKSPEQLQLQPQTAAEHADQSDSGLDFLPEESNSETELDSYSDEESVDVESGLPAPVELEPPTSSKQLLSNSSQRKKAGASIKGKSRHSCNRKGQTSTSHLTKRGSPNPSNEIGGTRKEAGADRTQALKGFYSAMPGLAKNKIGILSRATHKTAMTNELAKRKRIYEFFMAPVTTYWSFTLNYLIFLICFSYICLVKTPPTPTGVEWFVIIYIISLWCDCVRKILMAEPLEFLNKVKVFCYRIWNWMTLVSSMIFFAGFALRISNDDEIRLIGRLVYCINVMFWYIRLLDIFSVNSILGPYITMVGKMISNMVYICIILTVILAAFGLSRQAILFPREEFRWILVRDVFYKPYFMLYGEVYANEIDYCSDHGTHCEVGAWLTPFFMAVFLLLANILLINLLIAVFNNIFTETNAVAHQLWKFQRYTQVMEYESSPFLAPPLILFSHIYLLGKYICKDRFSKKRLAFDYALKLFLKPEEVEKIHDFEEEVMDEMMRRKEFDNVQSTTELIRKIDENTDMLVMRLNEVRHELATRNVPLKQTQNDLTANAAKPAASGSSVKVQQYDKLLQEQPSYDYDSPSPANSYLR